MNLVGYVNYLLGHGIPSTIPGEANAGCEMVFGNGKMSLCRKGCRRCKEFATNFQQIAETQDLSKVKSRNIYFFEDDNCNFSGSHSVFSHSRPEGNGRVVLWPLPGYHDAGCEQMGSGISKIDVPWDGKINKAFWRGASTGPWPSQHPYRACRLDLITASSEKCDAKFTKVCQTESATPEEIETARRNVAPLVDIKDMLKYKYLIVVEGNDLASNLPWALSSNSVVLMPRITREGIVANNRFLEPFQHYIPLKNNFKDLNQKIEWCEANQDACRNITKTANRYMNKIRAWQDLALVHIVSDTLGIKPKGVITNHQNNKLWIGMVLLVLVILAVWLIK
jgi:glycosyl transferase family 90